MNSHPRAIDRATLDNLLATTGNDSAFLAELIDTYLLDAAALLRAMQHAIEVDNAEELRRSAHSLKSSSASLGASGLADVCAEVEQQARAGVPSDAAERVLEMQAAYTTVERELRAFAAGQLR
jgi:two-component system, sensor histidine kinase and response regulator